MAKKVDKQRKAVEKIRKSIRKAVSKGVSPSAVSAAIQDALPNTAAAEPEALETITPEAPTVRKISGLNKHNPITLKHGYTGAEAPSAKRSGVNKEPLKPDSKKPSLKKLPGKTKPPTLRRGKNS